MSKLLDVITYVFFGGLVIYGIYDLSFLIDFIDDILNEITLTFIFVCFGVFHILKTIVNANRHLASLIHELKETLVIVNENLGVVNDNILASSQDKNEPDLGG